MRKLRMGAAIKALASDSSTKSHIVKYLFNVYPKKETICRTCFFDTQPTKPPSCQKPYLHI